MSEQKECPTNQIIFQGFEWYCPSDRQHWQRLAKALPDLAAFGVTHIWIPATKADCRNGNGYAIYDPYDLGEFDHKGLISTKWGKDDLVGLVMAADSYGVAILFGTVLNHKATADYKELVHAVMLDLEDSYPTKYDTKSRE